MSEWSNAEAWFKAEVAKLDGDARRDAEQAYADLKARLEPAVATLKADLLAAVPGVETVLEQLLAKFLASIVPEMASTGDGDRPE
jgi:hypothetical protein